MSEARRKPKSWKGKGKYCQNPSCPNKHHIDVAIFKGSGACSADCKKALGIDVSSVGTMMFVTTAEKEVIDNGRRTGNA